MRKNTLYDLDNLAIRASKPYGPHFVMEFIVEIIANYVVFTIIFNRILRGESWPYLYTAIS